MACWYRGARAAFLAGSSRRRKRQFCWLPPDGARIGRIEDAGLDVVGDGVRADPAHGAGRVQRLVEFHGRRHYVGPGDHAGAGRRSPVPQGRFGQRTATWQASESGREHPGSDRTRPRTSPPGPPRRCRRRRTRSRRRRCPEPGAATARPRRPRSGGRSSPHRSTRSRPSAARDTPPCPSGTPSRRRRPSAGRPGTGARRSAAPGTTAGPAQPTAAAELLELTREVILARATIPKTKATRNRASVQNPTMIPARARRSPRWVPRDRRISRRARKPKMIPSTEPTPSSPRSERTNEPTAIPLNRRTTGGGRQVHARSPTR